MFEPRISLHSLSLLSLALLLAACDPQGVVGANGLLGGGADGPGGDGEGGDGVSDSWEDGGELPGDEYGMPGDDDDSHDHPAGALHPDTLLVEEHDCFDYADVLTEDRSRIELGFTCDVGSVGLEPGRIVAGIDDGGYLVRIVSANLDTNNNVAVLDTEFASLAEAVIDVDFDETFEFAERRVIDFSGRTLVDQPVEGGTATVTVTRGSLNTQPTMNARGSFGFLRLKSVTSRNRMSFGLGMDVDYATDGPVEAGDSVVIDTYVHPFTLKVGPVRVNGQLHTTMRLVFEDSSDGPIAGATSMDSQGFVEMGGTYTHSNGGWAQHWNPNMSGTVEPMDPDGSGNWNGKVTFRIDGKVTLNGNPGGTSIYEFHSNGSTQSDCEALNWNTSATLGALTTMQLRMMGRSLDHQYPNISEVFDSKSGAVAHEVLPPGCGDDPGPSGDDDDAPGDDDDDPTDPEDPTDPADLEPGVCAPAAAINLGDVVTADTSTDPMAGTSMTAYPCNVGNYEAPELVYEWTATTSSPVSFSFIDARPTQLNLDMIVLDGSSGSCNADACVAHGFNSVDFEPVAGNTYYLVVDGFWDQAGAFQAVLDYE